LGPEAIIGLRVATTPAVVAIQNADIDYVTLPPDMPVSAIAQFMEELKSTDITTPVVATGDINLENAAAYMATGISGVATAAPAYAKDPVEYTTRLIEALENSKR
ncbi:MAG: thiamine phosphate synthase, partial [Muribaculaceae bacterium]